MKNGKPSPAPAAPARKMPRDKLAKLCELIGKENRAQKHAETQGNRYLAAKLERESFLLEAFIELGVPDPSMYEIDTDTGELRRKAPASQRQ